LKLRAPQKRDREKRLKVLVADDSEAVRQVLRRLFAGLPQFQMVGEAEDGCEALESIRRWQPDLVILDIHMPRMNGLEVLQALKGQSLSCKLIVLSQHDEESYRHKCMELGAIAFFDKVTGFDQFHQLLKQMRHPDPGTTI
jgi:YesN/AraC family two-component response regulator